MADSLNLPQAASSKVPIEILKLENHLHQPPIIQNVGKRKKEILVEKMKSLDMKVSKRNMKQLTEKMKSMQVKSICNYAF